MRGRDRRPGPRLIPDVSVLDSGCADCDSIIGAVGGCLLHPGDRLPAGHQLAVSRARARRSPRGGWEEAVHATSRPRLANWGDGGRQRSRPWAKAR